MLDIGDVETLRLVEVKNEDGNLTDPSEVILEIRQPDGDVVTKTYTGDEILRRGEGDFYFPLALTQGGSWQYRWRTEGGVDTTVPGQLLVGVETLTDPFPDGEFQVADVWAHSAALRARYPAGGGDGDLSILVSVTAPLVAQMTGRAFAGISEGEAVPSALVPIALQCIAMKTEQFDAAVGSAKNRKRSLNRGNLASFSAGSYSESYFGPDQAIRAKKLDADPVLSELLWALCTEEKRLYWLAFWDPENYPMGEMTIQGVQYGNRPNYSPRGGYGWW